MLRKGMGHKAYDAYLLDVSSKEHVKTEVIMSQAVK